jgi:ABC-type branched-subunit amino acid transport system ATPase component
MEARTGTASCSKLTILLAEQRCGFSLNDSVHVYVVERPQVEHSGAAAELAQDENSQHRLLTA